MVRGFAAITSGCGRLSVSSNDSSRNQKISSDAFRVTTVAGATAARSHHASFPATRYPAYSTWNFPLSMPALASMTVDPIVRVPVGPGTGTSPTSTHPTSVSRGLGSAERLVLLLRDRSGIRHPS